MSNESSQTSKFQWIIRIFAVIGMLVTIAGGVTSLYWTLTQLYDRNIDYSVKAKGSVIEYPLPPDRIASLPKEIQGVKSVWRFAVKNSGRETLEDTKLDKLPEGLYRLILNGKEGPTEVCNGTIALPRLSSGDDLKVIIWALTDAVLPTFEQAPILNHKRGSVDIEYARIFSALDETQLFILICSSITLLAFSLGACIYIVILKERLKRFVRK